MKISPLSPDDAQTCAEAFAVEDAAGAFDCPDGIGGTLRSYTGLLRHGWDGEPPVAYVARDDAGQVVGTVGVSLPERENTHLAWAQVVVHPEHRRRGYGSEMLAFITEVSKEHNRRVQGIGGDDLPSARGFAERHGFEQKSVDVRRRQLIADLDWPTLDKLSGEAEAAASDYELVRIRNRVPDELLDRMVELTAALNDAPVDDLDYDDEVFSPDRLRAFETAQEAWGRTTYRTVARHKESGELAGHSMVGVELDRPEVGWQLDTAVARAHRGHKLGLLVKVDMLRWLRDAEPRLVSFDTWNAESNQHMIAVNEQMGYRVVVRELMFQRDI